MRSLIGGVAATAAVKMWPFRVYSFPSQVQTDDLADIYAKIQQGYDEPSSGFVLFGAGVKFSSPSGLRALSLANGNKIHFNLHPLQRELIRGLK